MHAHDSALNLALYPVNIAKSTVARVPVLIVTPVEPIPAIRADRVLICLHGGGFTTDSGARTESIPIAQLTRSKVVSVLYRLAPEHPFPAAVDDSVAVYKELLKTYQPRHIGIYGASAGSILTRSYRENYGLSQKEDASDLPRVWNDPHTSARDRKWMLRLLIEDVTLVKEHKIHIHIRWKGGATSSLERPLPLSAPALVRTPAEIVELVRALATEQTYAQIARTLNVCVWPSTGLTTGRSRG